MADARKELSVPIVSTREELRRSLASTEFRVYSCLNGFTLRSLVNDGEYDSLLAAGRSLFVLDGLWASSVLHRRGVKADRICGRDLLDDALASFDGPRVAIGGREPLDGRVQGAIAGYVGSPVTVYAPPMFQGADHIRRYAEEVAPQLPRHALVMIFVRSPFQDLLAGELSKLRDDSVFVNVGALLDDILANRVRWARRFSRLRLEWAYRLFVTPARTFPKLLAMARSPAAIDRSSYRWHVI